MPNKSNSTETGTRISDPGKGRGHPVSNPGISTGKGGGNSGGGGSGGGGGNGSSGGTKKP